jgi:hypothetical protein
MPTGFGLGVIDQLEPFQRYTSVLVVSAAVVN